MRIFAASPGALQRSFDFLTQRGRVVSLVGGGGKSTLMYFLAQTCARQCSGWSRCGFLPRLQNCC